MVLQEDTYVDDVTTGSATVEEAIQFQEDLVHLLESGGFNLHKWSTNDPHVLCNVPGDERQVQENAHNLDYNHIIKIF